MTTVQKISLTIAVLGFLAGAGTQMTDIFAPFGSIAPVIVKEIVSLSGFVSGILAVVMTVLSGQVGQIRAVQEMPGIEKITVNSQANATLATMAVDPDNTKIQATPQAKQAVQATATAAA